MERKIHKEACSSFYLQKMSEHMDGSTCSCCEHWHGKRRVDILQMFLRWSVSVGRKQCSFKCFYCWFDSPYLSKATNDKWSKILRHTATQCNCDISFVKCCLSTLKLPEKTETSRWTYSFEKSVKAAKLKPLFLVKLSMITRTKFTSFLCF